MGERDILSFHVASLVKSTLEKKRHHLNRIGHFLLNHIGKLIGTPPQSICNRGVSPFSVLIGKQYQNAGPIAAVIVLDLITLCSCN